MSTELRQLDRSMQRKKHIGNIWNRSMFVGFQQSLSCSDDAMQEAQHEGSGAPPITELIPKGSFDDNPSYLRQLMF